MEQDSQLMRRITRPPTMNEYLKDKRPSTLSSSENHDPNMSPKRKGKDRRKPPPSEESGDINPREKTTTPSCPPKNIPPGRTNDHPDDPKPNVLVAKQTVLNGPPKLLIARKRLKRKPTSLKTRAHALKNKWVKISDEQGEVRNAKIGLVTTKGFKEEEKTSN